MWWIAQAVPPNIAGLPSWLLNGLSVGSLVMFIIVGLVTSRLWTKSQVDRLIERYEKALVDQKERYELHLTRTVELYRLHADEAIRREKEWRDTANTWQQVVQSLSQGIEPLQEQSATILEILRAWQTSFRPGRGRQ